MPICSAASRTLHTLDRQLAAISSEAISPAAEKGSGDAPARAVDVG
jgi:hypothetical protein